MLETAAILCVLIGCIHSYLGERFILISLFRRDNIPRLFGSDWFTKRTLRFAWHLTTIAWFGFAALLLVLSDGNGIVTESVLYTVGAVFLISGLLAFAYTKGRHLSWIVFWAIAGICFHMAMGA